MVSAMRGVPAWIDIIVVAALLVSLSLLIPRRERLPGFAVFLILACVLAGLNQHRLQPWFLQLILFAALKLVNSERFVRNARLLLVSVYVFSAISKFDYVFVHTLGQQFTDATLASMETDTPGGAPAYDLKSLGRPN